MTADRIIRVLVVVFAIASLGLLGYSISTGFAGTTTSGTGNITPNVSYDDVGQFFTIQNGDTFDWQNVTLVVNSSFGLDFGLMISGQTYFFPASVFTANDGTPFDPVASPPQKLDITCLLPDGSTGSWTGTSP